MNNITTAIDEVVKLKLEAVDEFIKQTIEPIVKDLGNPEKLIGIPWDQWTPEIRQMLYGIYGKSLEDFIARKAIAQMREHEAEVV